MDDMNSLKFYRSFFEAIDDLDDKDRLALYDAIMRYQFNGIEPKFENKYLKAMWKTLVPNIDSYNKSVFEGKKGGAPAGNSNAKKKTTKKQPKTTPLVLKNNPPCPTKTTEEEEEVEAEVEVEVEVDADDEIESSAAPARDEVMHFYLNNINSTPVPKEVELLSSFEKDLPKDLIIFAMEKAVENKARNLGYIKGILNKWQQKGINTLAEAKDEVKNKASPKAEATNKFYDTTSQYGDSSRFYANL